MVDETDKVHDFTRADGVEGHARRREEDEIVTTTTTRQSEERRREKKEREGDRALGRGEEEDDARTKSVKSSADDAALSMERSSPMEGSAVNAALLELDSAAARALVGTDDAELPRVRSNIFLNAATRKTVSPLLAAINLLEVLEESRDTYGSFDVEDVRLLKKLLLADNAHETNLFYPIKKNTLSRRQQMRVSSIAVGPNDARIATSETTTETILDIVADESGGSGESGRREREEEEEEETGFWETSELDAATSLARSGKTVSTVSTESTDGEGYDDDDDGGGGGGDGGDDDDEHLLDAFTDFPRSRFPGRGIKQILLRGGSNVSRKLTMSTRVITKTVSWKRRAESRKIKEDVLATIDLDKDTNGLRGAFKTTGMRQLVNFDTRHKWRKVARDAVFVDRAESQMETGGSESAALYPSVGHLTMYLRHLLPGVDMCIRSDDEGFGTGGDGNVDTVGEPSSSPLSPTAPVAASNTERLSRVLQACDSIDWRGFDVFELDTLTHGHCLSTLIFVAFEKSGLIRHYGLSARHLRDFALEVERRMTMNENCYHNAKHVACFVQTLFAQLSNGSGVLFSHPLERLSLLFAACVHDLDHPGLTNDFLIKTSHDWAILYNDRAVAENHHATAAFTMLRSVGRHRADAKADAPTAGGDGANAVPTNFLGNVLTAEDFRRFRLIVIETILATDMRAHFTIAGNVQVLLHRYEQERASSSARDDGRGCWPLIKAKRDDNDRMTLMKLLMKISDLSHLTLRRHLHVQWVGMLQEEFYQQGDREKELGMPISFMMDREKQEMYDAQPGFFDGIAMPIFNYYASVFGVSAGGYMWSRLQSNLRYWKRRARDGKQSSSSTST